MTVKKKTVKQTQTKNAPRIVAASATHSGLKVCHVSMFNQSGMHRVAESLSTAEKVLGLDSHLVNMHETSPEALDAIADSDIFVAHTHFPNEIKKRATKDYKLVFPSHGAPEYIWNSAIEDGKKGYGHGDGLMLWQYWMSHADAIVTFWPRHQAMMQTMVDKHTKVNLVPLGVDKKFWAGGFDKGKFAGNPSLFTAENCHTIKWPWDLFILWPWIYKELPEACLHANYLPTDQHRWWFPLVNRNGASYGCHISALTFAHADLRNIFRSVDYMIGLVRYGDMNKMSLEANAAGCQTISYEGNPYSSFYLREGDQRRMAQDLLAILKGEVEPRADKEEVPDISETAAAFKKIYEETI